MFSGVAPSDRYEGQRANYRAVKRPTGSGINGRHVSPRLVQELPTDEIKGLGRRKIPATTQRPTRGTNVPIVYSRLLQRVELPPGGAFAMHPGDVVLVGQFTTACGPRGRSNAGVPVTQATSAGTNRFSRVATWRQINAVLARDDNALDPRDLSLASRLDDTRLQWFHDLHTVIEHHVRPEHDGMMRKAGQTVEREYTDLYTGLSAKRTEMIAFCMNARQNASKGMPVEVVPHVDWTAVPALREWRVDGVLLSTDLSKEVINEVLPDAADSELLLNIVVQGPCVLRNKKHSGNDGQFLEREPQMADAVYLCIVCSVDEGTGVVRFQLKPTTAHRVHVLIETLDDDDTSEFTLDDLINTVAAWRVGRVVDTKLVSAPREALQVHVAVELLTLFAFWGSLGFDPYGRTALDLQRKRDAKRAARAARRVVVLPAAATWVDRAKAILAYIARATGGLAMATRGARMLWEMQRRAEAEARRLADMALATADSVVRPLVGDALSAQLESVGAYVWRKVVAAGKTIAAPPKRVAAMSLPILKSASKLLPDGASKGVSIMAAVAGIRAAVVGMAPPRQRTVHSAAATLRESAFFPALDRTIAEDIDPESYAGVCRTLEDVTIARFGGRAFGALCRRLCNIFHYHLGMEPELDGGRARFATPGPGEPLRVSHPTLRVSFDRIVPDDVVHKTDMMSHALNTLFMLPERILWTTPDGGTTWERIDEDRDEWPEWQAATKGWIEMVTKYSFLEGIPAGDFFGILTTVIFGWRMFNRTAQLLIRNQEDQDRFEEQLLDNAGVLDKVFPQGFEGALSESTELALVPPVQLIKMVPPFLLWLGMDSLKRLVASLRPTPVPNPLPTPPPGVETVQLFNLMALAALQPAPADGPTPSPSTQISPDMSTDLVIARPGNVAPTPQTVRAVYWVLSTAALAYAGVTNVAYGFGLEWQT